MRLLLLLLFGSLSLVGCVVGAPPSGVTAAPVSPSQVRLAWTDTNRGTLPYAVERSVSATSGFAQIALTASGATAWTDGGLASGVTYYYRLRAKGRNGGYSSYSAVASATTPDGVPPSVPTGLTVRATDCHTVSIAWTAASDTGGSGLKGYNLYRGGVLLKQVAAPATATTDGGLTPGTTYTAAVSAVDGGGNESARSASVAATVPACANQAPVSNAGPDQMTQTLTAISFSGAASSDPDGSVVAWAWSFGDGATASGKTVTHAYARPGSYTATLTVTDDGGRTASDTAAVSVANRPPVANAGPDQTATVGAPVAFSGTGSSDPDGSVTAWAWTFGDGTSANGATASHAYAATGTYVATLTVTDDKGARTSDTAAVTVRTASSGGQLLWARLFGSAGYEVAQAVAVDASGNVVVTGAAGGAIDLGGVVCSSTIFVAKYTPAGALVWVRCLPGAGDGAGRAVAVDASGNVLVTGNFRGTMDFGGGALTSAGGHDVFLAKYTAAGAHVWSRRFGSATASALVTEAGDGVAVDPSGNVAITGTFEGTADFGGGPLTSAGGQDGFVAKFTAAGAPVWSRRFGDAYGDGGAGVAMDASGNVLVTGTYIGTADFGGGPRTSAGYDAFVAKYDPSGAHFWSRQYGGTLADYGKAIAVDAAGNVFFAGSFMNTVDFGGGPLTSAGDNDVFVAKLSASGGHVWSKAFGSTSAYDSATALAVDPNGGVVVGGYFSRTVDFGSGPLVSAGSDDAFVARYTAAGVPVWARRFGGSNIDEAYGVAVDAGGNVVASGLFFATVDFGAGPVTSAGGSDAFLLRLAP